MTTNINELNLTEEAVPEVDWDAPEGGLYPPSVPVGKHDFIFALGEDPYDSYEKDGKRYLRVTYDATTTVDGVDKTLRFQRASSYQSENMKKSRRLAMIYNLLRGLAIRVDQPTSANIAAALEAASNEGRHFSATVNWRGYCDHGNKEKREEALEVSTNPSKKKIAAGTQFAWPRNAEGQFELFVSCPKCKTGMKVNAEISDIHLPEKSGTSASTNGTGHGPISVNL